MRFAFGLLKTRIFVARSFFVFSAYFCNPLANEKENLALTYINCHMKCINSATQHCSFTFAALLTVKSSHVVDMHSHYILLPLIQSSFESECPLGYFLRSEKHSNNNSSDKKE